MQQVRYAVVGLGHIAQTAMLPAFALASDNASVTALVSSDREKMRRLGNLYSAPHHWTYDEYDRCLESGEVDAVYIALPNSMHREYAVRAARAGVHVLVEKPMAPSISDCHAMIEAATRGGVKLMVAYRLYFEPANLLAVETVRSGKLGTLRLFDSVFSVEIGAGNIRLDEELGGGALYDIGVYCINAVRRLFADEPIEVTALTASRGGTRFSQVDDITGAVMRFANKRIGTFVCSMSSIPAAQLRLVGSDGDLVLDNAYFYRDRITYRLRVGQHVKTTTFDLQNQFAPLISHFSDCILNDRQPLPSGEEGLADVAVIEALYRSARTGRAATVEKMRTAASR